MLSRDDLKLAELGTGVDGDGETKSALFCVIPDSDKSYNFIIGMLYTQIFQELYYQADFNCGGRLPVHVTFLLDEFANVALPDDYCSLLSTMRSREISSIIIIQNFAQLKALFKDTWETVPGNCDTFIYLGGNEQSTHKYVSELLGKGTIDKKSSGETKGRHGSSSRNYDVLGRELFTPDEVRKLDNRKCIIFIRGFDPVMDNKFVPFSHPAFSQTADGGGKPYVHTPKQGGDEAKPYQLLTKKSLAYYEELKKKGGNVYIDRLDYRELGLLTEPEMKKRLLDQEGQQKENPCEGKPDGCRNVQKVRLDKKENLSETQDTGKTPARRQENQRHQGTQKIPVQRGKLSGEDTIVNRMAQWQYTQEQKNELHKMMDIGMPQEDILSVFYPETEAGEMHRFLLAFQKARDLGT